MKIEKINIETGIWDESITIVRSKESNSVKTDN